MKALHRLVGNLPGRGHGVPLMSASFPVYAHAELTRIVEYRLPSAGMAAPGSVVTMTDGITELMNIYEVHAVNYGQYAAVSSKIITRQQLRPYNYSDVILLADDQEAVLPQTSLKTILACDAFVTPEVFLNINPVLMQYPVSPWKPVEYQPGPWKSEMSEGMRCSLLAGFWRNASNRMFQRPFAPLTVCIGPEERPEALFRQAKDFLLAGMLPSLPEAVSCIVSMAVGVPHNGIGGIFDDTAWIVVAPNVVNQEEVRPCAPDYDLRTGKYPALDAEEEAFIRAVIHGAGPKLLEDMRQRYGKVTGRTQARDCTLMADYDISLLLYRFEQNRIGVDGLLDMWKKLYDLLTRRHSLTEKQANEVLFGVVQAIFSRLFRDGAPVSAAYGAAGDGQFEFLWKRALTVQDALFPSLQTLMAAYPNAVSNTIRMLPVQPEEPSQDARVCSLLTAVFDAYDAPLSKEQVASLTAPAFSAQWPRRPELQRALTRMVSQSNQRHKEHWLTTLPLTAMLGNGSDSLNAVLESMLEKAPVMPDAALCRDIQPVYAQYASARSEELLCQISAKTLSAKPGGLTALLNVLAVIEPETSSIIATLFDCAREKSLALGVDQLRSLFDTLQPLCKKAAKVNQAYLAYERQAAQYERLSPADRQARLVELAPCLEKLHADLTQPVVDILDAAAAQGRPMQAEQIARLEKPLWRFCADQPRVSKAFARHVEKIVEDGSAQIFAHAEALAAYEPLIRTAAYDLTASLSRLLHDAGERRQPLPKDDLCSLLRQLLPLCWDQEAVFRALMEALEVIAQDALGRQQDSLPWLYELLNSVPSQWQDRARQESHRMNMLLLALRYRCQFTVTYRALMDQQALSLLVDLSRNHPKSFAQIEMDVKRAYDALFACYGQQADQQTKLIAEFQQIFPNTASVGNFQALGPAMQHALARELAENWKKKDYFLAVEEISDRIKRSGVKEDALLREIQAEAERNLQRRFAQYTSPQAYQADYERHQKPRTVFDEVWLIQIRRMLTERFETLLTGCQSVEDAAYLQKTAQQIGCWQDVARGKAGKLCQQTLELGEFIRRCPNEPQPQAAFAQAFHQLTSLGVDGALIPPMLLATCQKLWRESAEDRSTLVYAGLMGTYLPAKQSFQWDELLRLLCPADEKILSQPFSADGQYVLGTISALMNLLAGMNTQWADQLVNYLNQSEPYAGFSRRLARNRKQLKQLFPPDADLPGRRTVAGWLGLPM